MFIVNFIYGIILIVIGVVLLMNNFKITNLFSRNNWFERNLGSGSSYMIFQLVAFGTVVVGVLVMFGLGDNIVNFVLSPFKGLFNLEV